MLTLHDDPISGNGYKVRLLLRLLGRPFRLVEYDILKGETRTPAFLAKNPNGRIPLLELEDGRLLSESGAILVHLAEGSQYLPADPFDRAKVLQWMFWEQYNHEPNIATSRFLVQHRDRTPEIQAELDRRKAPGNAALKLMDDHLARHDFLVASYGIADIALYAYTHAAEEGEFSLEPYPAIRAWMARVAAQPGHVPMGKA